MIYLGTSMAADIPCTIVSSFMSTKTVELADRCEFRNNQAETIFVVSKEEGLTFPNMNAKEAAFYLAKVLLDPDFSELRIMADRISFAETVLVQKDDDGKYVMEWLRSEPPEQFLELQKEFNRVMDLWVFA